MPKKIIIEPSAESAVNKLTRVALPSNMAASHMDHFVRYRGDLGDYVAMFQS